MNNYKIYIDNEEISKECTNPKEHNLFNQDKFFIQI